MVEQLVRDWNIKPVRILAGTFMTSLNGPGFSISLLKVFDSELGNDTAILDLLDAPVEATGWSAAISTKTWSTQGQRTKERKASDADGISPSNLRGTNVDVV